MRLWIYIRSVKENYYDVGLRKYNQNLSKECWRWGKKAPRFLEDFIEYYHKKDIEVRDYGDLIDDKEYIDKILG